MLKNRILDSVVTPDGRELVLYQHGNMFAIRVDDDDLMSSRMHGSEEELARLGLLALDKRPAPRVLVGGLGMGFTLRAVLDGLRGRPQAQVVVAELFPAVVSWNRTYLGELARHPLQDPRVVVEEGDVAKLLARSKEGFDLILLDVDNGPEAFTLDDNHDLYTEKGIATCRAALREGGVVAFWSAGDDHAFAWRLQCGGFEAEVHRVPARPGGKGGRHVIFLGVCR